MSPPTQTPVEPSGGDDPAWSSPTQGTALPYDFVPVLPQAMHAEEPVWHDGSHPDPESLYSGELHCTLMTLTPTLVGNQQFGFSECTDDLQTLIHNVVRLGGVHEKLKTDKKLLLPLCLGDPQSSPILIPGEAMAGMVRHSIGALLNAPMERVGAANFSYRPNIEVPREVTASRPMAAEVVGFNVATRLLQLKLIADIRAVEFVHGDDATLFPGPLPQNLPAGHTRTGWVRQPRPGSRYRISPDALSTLTLPLACRALRYSFGLDGIDGFHKKTDNLGNRTTTRHQSVVVPAGSIDATPVTVDPAVVAQYLETNDHLKDSQEGHRSRAMIAKPSDKGWQPTIDLIEAGDLIFCEVLPAGAGVPARVVSFGRNFRYRWRHLDSVTERAIAFDEASKTWVFDPRPEMRPLAAEQAGSDGRPQALTAVRNMFGYVIDSKSNGASGSPAAGQDGSGPANGHSRNGPPREAIRSGQPDFADPFNRMAGRVSFNFAMERMAADETGAPRFVNADGEALVLLHPTAAPKPQFARAYVPGTTRTWGEGLLRQGSKLLVQGATRHFAGRKFYPPQGYDARSKRFDLPAYHYDLLALLQAPVGLKALTRQQLMEQVAGNQAAIARWMSAPGRSFGFTVRFKQLRAHELGALVAALEPARLARAAKLTGFEHGFALKIGHGRALGMGSVQVRIDSGLRWPYALGQATGPLEPERLDACVCDALLPRLDQTVYQQWLQVQSVKPSRAIRPYLLSHDGKTMTDWCSDERKKQLQARRENPNPRPPPPVPGAGFGGAKAKR